MTPSTRCLWSAGSAANALTLVVPEMYVKGVSTRKVKAVTELLCGFEVSSSDVSRATALLEDDPAAWRTKPIGETPHLILDPRYERVRHGGAVIDCAVLVAVGIGADGKRRVLEARVSLSEAEVHWRDLLASLKARGMIGVRFAVSDDHAGLKATRRAELPSAPWQRCQFHVQRNAAGRIPQVAMRKELAHAIRSIFKAGDRAAADARLAEVVKANKVRAPPLAEWLENAILEARTIFTVPESHQRLLRTVNGLEYLNKQIKRRTGLFPNDNSLLRLVSAVLAEISDDWQTGRIYLAMEAD